MQPPPRSLVTAMVDPMALWQRIPGLVVVLTPQGRGLFISADYAASTGTALDLDQGSGWDAALEPASRSTLWERLPSRSHFVAQVVLRFVDGSDHWIEWTAHWQPEGGHYLCLLHDVTTLMRSARTQAEQLRLLADNVPSALAYYDAHDFRCIFANRTYAEAFGWDEHSIVGHTFAEVIGEQAAREIEPYVQALLTQRRSISYERQAVRPDGSTQWIKVNLMPHLDASGAPQAALVLITDVTQQRQAEQALRESEERMARFMHASAEGVVFHSNGIIEDVNQPVCDLTGYSREALIGRNALDFVPPEHHPKVLAVLAAAQDATYESEIIHRDGHRIAVEFIGRTMMRNGQRLRMSIVRDIRDRHLAQARIRHLAHHDALTGLPNRMSFMEHLDQRMDQARRTEDALALLFVDLDDFKRVNDSLGHLVGDRLLQTVAQRITASLRHSDRVARFGGDEFMVLLGAVRDRADVEDVARKLLEAIEQPIEVDALRLSVTPSIGIALFPAHAQSPGELIKHADRAMYQAKAQGRATFRFFDPALGSAARAALELESQLSRALDEDQFRLQFQPQVRAADGAIVCVEALLRWQHPDDRLLVPGDFLAVAEQQRLMLPIGHWVMRQALRTTRRWRERGLTDARMALNVSATQFQAPGFVEGIERMLAEEGADGQWLELELNERLLMHDVPQVKQRLSRLKALGARIVIDDFGTGHFSMRHLRELPVDKIKIHRSFVGDLPLAADSAAIACAIIQMARHFGHDIVAEGVETLDQRNFLMAQGCEVFQGEVITLPLTADAFEAWVQAQRPCRQP
ncbi:putative bifunctional diguanylate cyclase/phosphodiesterase [Caldimonas taiwanensis]|uniref:putative bifunctional diguanylate cyclase/phosphodiesterase n=1 Tax=Caldimonas taiwanensis TaxID=307483 RepID=UPI001E57057D|nr:GGDEF and EAL domain-containing protein [Caldimonas taiwanensis]